MNIIIHVIHFIFCHTDDSETIVISTSRLPLKLKIHKHTFIVKINIMTKVFHQSDRKYSHSTFNQARHDWLFKLTEITTDLSNYLKFSTSTSFDYKTHDLEKKKSRNTSNQTTTPESKLFNKCRTNTTWKIHLKKITRSFSSCSLHTTERLIFAWYSGYRPRLCYKQRSIIWSHGSPAVIMKWRASLRTNYVILVQVSQRRWNCTYRRCSSVDNNFQDGTRLFGRDTSSFAGLCAKDGPLN